MVNVDQDLEVNLAIVSRRISEAARRAGRDPAQVQLVAVTKTVPVEKIKRVVECGVKQLGENRVQELMDKIPLLPQGVKWHMIGHLQRNKVKYLIGRVSMIQSLDRWSLAEEIQKRAEKQGTSVSALVQVNVAGEETKYGLEVAEVKDFLEAVSSLNFIRVRGLMTIAPYTEDAEEVRPVFRKLRHLAMEISTSVPGVRLDYLSMGMTNDFEVAVEEGSNMLRIGSAIFGPRNY